VDDIVTVARSRPPRNAGEVFPCMSVEGCPVELLNGLDNTQWLPRHVEDSLEPDNNMWLMKSTFGHIYMIMGGRGTSLFQRDPTWNEPADPPEVQLEYQSWSKGSWDRGSLGSRIRPIPRD
jgi:hypothetical protein